MVFRCHKRWWLVGLGHDTYLVRQVFDDLVFQDQLALEFVIVFLQHFEGVVFAVVRDIARGVDHGVFHVLVGAAID